MNWSQIWTVLWLRWRLTRNQWARAGKVSVVITLIAAVIAVLIGVAGALGGVLAGAFALAQAPPLVLLLVWDGIFGLFLFLWLIGVLAELQRSEAIDLGRLLHLPVSLQGIFVVNYLASHLTLSIVLFLPGMLGLCLGLSLSKGPAMLWLLPLVLSFIFMVTTWTYCLRGWLISLMVNQRRRRTVLVAVTLGFMILAQLPNLYLNLLGQGRRQRNPLVPTNTYQPGEPGPAPGAAIKTPKIPPGFLAAHKYVPILWAGNGAMTLATGNPWPAIGGMFGGAILGALGLMRAYKATLRFYQGADTAKVTKKKPQVTPAAQPTWLEKTLPGVPGEASTLALAFFRSMTRAPELKMALGMNFFMLIVLSATIIPQGLKSPPEPALKGFMAAGAVAFQFMGLLQSMFNQFGFDRDGFRALVLLPVPRKHILLAKNLSFLPLAAGGALLFLAIMAVVARLPPIVMLAAACQFLFGFLLLNGVGNLMSIYFPYRIAIGSLKPTKMPGTTKIMLIISHLCFPLAMVPMFIPPVLAYLLEAFGGWPGTLVNLLSSIVLAATAAWFYWLSLEGLGRLLQRREQAILQVVTTEVE